MDPERILAGLNEAQRQAVEAVRGPVCILAGAGTGKTTTITRRIAYQVATKAFTAREILAVTFTDKAAGEMRERLKALGVSGVRARTFHATALAQLHHFRPDTGAILPTKAALLAPIVSSLHRAYRFRPLSEVAGEIEWAKNRRLTPAGYVKGLDGHVPPVPADLMQRVFRRYEEAKRRAGRIDFEDVLELLAGVYESSSQACERFRAGCRAITVDEYQDVNLLQQALLDLWLGERDELCVVGDDYQAIYSFTGATPEHLLSMPRRFPHARVFRLEENYRSTPEILELANRLVPRLGGAPKTLRAACAAGPELELRPFASAAAEVDWVVERIAALRSEGVADEEIALLYRVNSRSDDFEGPLTLAGIPFQVRGGAFLSRPAARAVLRLLRRQQAEPAAEAVGRAVVEAGLVDPIPDRLGEDGLTFQNDLRRVVRMAADFGSGTAADFVADLRARFQTEGDGRGVQLLTYHRAKGLEFEVVLLPFLQAGELPIRQAKTDEAVEEERRLLYVGLTRAKRRLALTWTEKGRSRFLDELGVETLPARSPVAADDPLLVSLKAWRRARAKAAGVPAYVVFSDRTLAAIAHGRPASLTELASVSGVGPVKLERYGDEVLATLATVAA